MPFLTHKLILVASSAVSEGIFRKDPHPYPLVYVKGGGGPPLSLRTRRDKIPEAVDRGHQGPRRGAGPSKLRGRERRTVARVAIEIGDTTEETVNVNETTPEPVEETENAENTEKSVNDTNIYFST